MAADAAAVSRGEARERVEQEKAKQRILDLARRDDPGGQHRWNGPTVIIPRDQRLLTRGGEHRTGQTGDTR